MSISVDRIHNLEREVEHWKNVAEQNKTKFESTHEEFEEFQTESKALERELETQIEQLDRRNRDLLFSNQKMTMEHESTRARLQSLQVENSEQVDRLEAELTKVKNERDEMHRYIRDLEQTNDDLERAKRTALVSLEDFERRLNEAIERNAFLENELDEKDDLQTYVQRLKEETRDLKQELKVKDRRSTTSAVESRERTPGQRPSSLTLSGHIANGSVARMSGSTAENSSESRKTSNHTPTSERSVEHLPTTPTAPFNASTRIAALTIVSDLIRKVGALEVKLSNSRRFSTDNYSLTPSTPANTSSIASTTVKSPNTSSNPKDRLK